MALAPVIALLGRLISLFAVTMLAPALCALAYGEFRAAGIFAGSAAVTVFFGVGMIFATQGAENRLRRGVDFLLVVAVWPIIAGFAAAPFLLLDVVATPTDAFFEAFSGLTTTGATVIGGLDDQLRSVLFWRAFLQWLGGLATIVMAVSVLPMLGAGGMQVFRGAMPHGDHATIVDRVRRSAMALSWIYALLTLICAIALWLAGMSGFDAIAYAFSTISSGGFTPHDGFIEVFGNPMIEVVLMVFMVIGVINFTLYWALLHGRPSVLYFDEECRMLYLVILFAALLAILVLNQQGELGAVDSIRQGLFATLSMVSTTGFVNQMATPWPAMLPVLFLALVFIGGSSGSTAGGIKLMRMCLAISQGRRELERLSHPHGVVRIHYAGQAVPESVVQALWSFFILFMLTFAGLSIMLSVFGLDPADAVPMALVTLTNAGAGLPLVTGAEATYALLPAAAKWILCFGMLMGRLELVAVVTVLTPMFWRR
ncbi:MAG: potassium transporter [Proteobacteria bacterium]|nr:potassium transporter [Pseudomonadota bacterium]